MVTTGNPSSSARKTEVVDVVTGESCADLANFPLANNGAVGANLNETPIVCGGVYSSYYQTWVVWVVLFKRRTVTTDMYFCYIVYIKYSGSQSSISASFSTVRGYETHREVFGDPFNGWPLPGIVSFRPSFSGRCEHSRSQSTVVKGTYSTLLSRIMFRCGNRT